MDEKEVYRLHASFCQFMSNPKRIEILFLLGDGEMSVDNIAKRMNIRIANVSQLLSVMRERGVVDVRRDGTKMLYRLSNPRILEACLIMRDIMFEEMKKKMEIIQKVNTKEYKEEKV